MSGGDAIPLICSPARDNNKYPPEVSLRRPVLFFDPMERENHEASPCSPFSIHLPVRSSPRLPPHRDSGSRRPDAPPASRGQGRAAAADSPLADKSVIFLFLHGGPSQFETFDPKMTAPADIRSATGEIATVAARRHLRLDLPAPGRAGRQARRRPLLRSRRRQPRHQADRPPRDASAPTSAPSTPASPA